MAQSNVRSMQEASHKKKIAAVSLCAAGANFRDLWAPLRQPSTFSLSIASVHTQLSTRNKIVHIFYTALSRPPLSVSLTIFLSCPNRCSISSISNARQYLRFQMHVITHSLAHRPCLFQGALSGGRFIIQSPPPLPQLQLRDLQLHLICIPHQHLYYYPLPVKPPHVISNISPNPLSQTRIVRRRRLNRVYSAVSV